MNNSYIATALVIRDLNCFNLETIQDRILLQKKVYLFQDLGVSLGYGYSWYVHGPYSPDLATVAYQIIPEGSDSLRDKTIKQDFALVIKDVNDIEKEIMDRMEEKFDTVENGQEADTIALQMVKDIYEPIIKAIDSAYTVYVEFI